MRATSWLCLTAIVTAGALVFAQARQVPSFRTGVQLVRIDVSVLDDKRQPMRGLQASDFTVIEDGQPRPVRAFEAVDHARTAASVATAANGRATVAPDVTTNREGDDTSRLIFILMAQSISPERPMLMARQIADAAVDAMAPGDLAAIVTTSSLAPQNLTSDRARLHKTIAASDWSQRLSQAQLDDPIVGQILGMGDPLSDGRCLCGLCAMDTIASIAEQVRGVARRKILLFVGSDIIVQTADVGCDKRVQDSREHLFEALGASGMTVHSIDPNGLGNFGPATRATVPNGVEKRDGAALGQQLTQERTDFMVAQGNLAVLPAQTGGRTILNSNEPYRLVPEVLRESDAYYLLAFEPTEARGDVRHNLEVKVSRKGAHVSAPRYLLPPSATASTVSASNATPLARALTDVVPSAAMPIAMSAWSFDGRERTRAYVGVTLNVSSFAAKASGLIPLEIALLASDERGRTVASARQQGTIDVPASATPWGMAPFVELQSFIALPPGDYELHAAIMNATTHEASSVFTHVTVPRFDDARLTMSDVVIGMRENAGSLPQGAPPIPVVPTTMRVFEASTPAWAFLRVYHRPGATAAQAAVSVEMSVVDAAGKRVGHQTQQLPDSAFTERAADVRLPLPIQKLQPGRYVLRIDAAQGDDTVSRAIPFAVAAAVARATPGPRSAEVDATLEVASTYIEAYEHRISAIGAQEDYEQVSQARGGTAITGDLRGRQTASSQLAALTRKTRANIMTIDLGARGWVAFRDVFEVDGRNVGDRQERLSRILQNITPDSLEQARQVAAESARYNLNPSTARIDRTINVPMTALLYLRGANQSRSAFHLGKPERIDGVTCVTLQFTEQGQPRLIRTADNAPAEGTFWIEPASGRVVKSEMRMASSAGQGQSVSSKITVRYARVDKLDLWLPATMDESYELLPTHELLSGHATYSDFHEFTVTTSEGIK